MGHIFKFSTAQIVQDLMKANILAESKSGVRLGEHVKPTENLKKETGTIIFYHENESIALLQHKKIINYTLQKLMPNEK